MMKININKIGVIGVGFVGSAIKDYYQGIGYQVFLYDKFKNLGSVNEVNKADVVFVSVPTPYSDVRGYDISAVKEAVSLLKGSKIVVIKSTVVPGTTEYIQKSFPKHKVMFNPEFLREATALQDFKTPDRQVLGFTSRSKSCVAKVMAILPKSSIRLIMTSTEAETVKYMANSFLALKVVFANEFFDLCKQLGLNYQKVMEAVGYDKRINHSHLNVTHGGYRGYGGRCFPKDVNSIIRFAGEKGVGLPLLKAMRSINKCYLKLSGLSEKEFLLPQSKISKNKNGS